MKKRGKYWKTLHLYKPSNVVLFFLVGVATVYMYIQNLWEGGGHLVSSRENLSEDYEICQSGLSKENSPS